MKKMQMFMYLKIKPKIFEAETDKIEIRNKIFINSLQ